MGNTAMDKNFFDEDTVITAKDIRRLSEEQICEIQRKKDSRNIQEIYEAYYKSLINEEERDYLLKYYRDGMASYREVYRGMYETFGHPERIVCINPETGEVETHIRTYTDKRTGKKRRKTVESEYRFKDVTPFTCMRVEYRDSENNGVYIILPVMKKPKRAIQKIISYRVDYEEDLQKIREDYLRHGDRERYEREIAAVKKPHERVNDILRLTVTRKYYSGVEETMQDFRACKRLNINDEETRTSFYELDMEKEGNEERYRKNKKSYYDVKMFLHLKVNAGMDGDQIKTDTLSAEAQIKIHMLYYKADLLTHHDYEQIRVREEYLAENRDKMSPEEIRQIEAFIDIKKLGMQKTNKKAIHEYNMQVLDKVRWIEEDFKALRIPADYPDDTYEICRNLIKKDYMVRPFKILDLDKEFSPEDPLNRAAASDNGFDIGSLYEISRRYAPFIAKKYHKIRQYYADEKLQKDSSLLNAVPGTRYNPAADRKNWDGYGKAKKFRDLMNKNIYKDNYAGNYWQDYDRAVAEAAGQKKGKRTGDEKRLTKREIALYYRKQRLKATRSGR